MTLLSVVQSVTAAVGVQMPSSVFAAINSNRTMFEMLGNANEMAQRIAYNTREWQALKSIAVFTGDGVTRAFNLPADYKRMLLKTDVWRSTSAIQPMVFFPDINEWMQRRARAFQSSAWGEWTIYGNQMHIEDPLGAGTPAWVNNHRYAVGSIVVDPVDNSFWKNSVDHTSAATGTFAADRAAHSNYWSLSPITATFAYLNRNCINLASGGRGDRFMADGDSFVLDERLLKLGMIFNWKQQKGSPYAEDMGTYSDALQVEGGADSPSPIIIDGVPSSQLARNIAYPWHVPTP
jgi:hypothetical protein